MRVIYTIKIKYILYIATDGDDNNSILQKSARDFQVFYKYVYKRLVLTNENKVYI